MSGRDENPNPLRCPRCGSRKFKYVNYGYSVTYIDIDEGTTHNSDWVSDDGEGWDCAKCERRLPRELQDYMRELEYFDW